MLNFLYDNRGWAAVEYGLFLVFIGMIIIGVLKGMS